ncbi:MAG: DUF1385 domain-containing protein [Spirochaetota bacterium]
MKKKIDRRTVETVGGQAVIEGVMLRDKMHYAVAVRREKGDIVTKKEAIVSAASKYTLFKLPFLRGMLNFFEQLKLGYSILTYSADEAMTEEERKKEAAKKKKGNGDWVLTIALILSLVFAIALFKALPFVLTVLLGGLFNSKNMAVDHPIVFNSIAGVIKLLVFFFYLLAMSLMKDMRRMFQYHGAEHKVANAYEAGEKISPKTVKRFPVVHPRCGTTFIFLVLAVGVVVYIAMQPLINSLPGFRTMGKFQSNIAILAIQIGMLPFIAGISYELLKLAFRFEKNFVLQAAIFPGLLFQRLTTKEPDQKQIEVAIASFEKLKGA